MNPFAPITPADWLAGAAARLADAIPHHIERLSWDAERLRAHQNAALANLVRTAAGRSPFHRRRLAGIDPDGFTIDRLAELPVMTKAEMMVDFDGAMTDRRLNQSLVERHLTGLGEDPKLLLDQYIVIASGGSSGTRGVFVMAYSNVIDFAATVLRAGMARLAAHTGWPPPSRIPAAIVMAPKAIHATRAVTPLLSGIATLTYAPATLAFGEIVERLNRARPTILLAYPSTLARLGDAAIAGHLSIDPEMILVSGEQLLPDHVGRIVAGFRMPPANSFATSEGLAGSAPPGSDEFAFASDQAIVEFVDADDNPVPTGTTAHHVLVTNLANHIQPLIRYRLDDAMTELPPAPDHGHQRATLFGRNDELLTIGAATIHPLTIRTALLPHPTITEYQVTVDGGSRTDAQARLAVAVVTAGLADLARVERDLAAALAAAGAHADVTVTAVDQLGRHPETGKVRRFVTQGASPAIRPSS